MSATLEHENLAHVVIDDPHIIPAPKDSSRQSNSAINLPRLAPYTSFLAVGLIHPKFVTSPEVKNAPVACCVLVGRQWVLAAHHVIDSPEYARNFQVRFGYLGEFEKRSEAWSQSFSVEFSDEPGSFYCSEDGSLSNTGHSYHNGDWALLRLARPVPEGIKPLQPCAANVGDYVHIPTYSANASKALDPLQLFGLRDSTSDAQPREQRLFQVVEMEKKNLFHRAPATSGSSGSPLLLQDGRFIGIHVRSSGGRIINQATHVLAIARDLESQGFDAAGQGVTVSSISVS